MQELRILDCCSGSGSWLENWRNSHTYNIKLDAVDIVKRPHITHIQDIRTFKPEQPYHFVYGSPPCNHFSQMRNINKKKTTEADLKEALEIANAVFKLGKEAVFAYVIENPYTGLMPNYYPDYQIVDYSEYDYPLRKRTAIWSNINFKFKTKTKLSYNQTNLSALSLDNKWRIPKKLRDYIKWVLIKRFMQELKAFHLKQESPGL